MSLRHQVLPIMKLHWTGRVGASLVVAVGDIDTSPVAADEETNDPVSTQLFHERDMGAAVSTKTAKKGTPKKSKAARSAHQPPLEPRTTRSGDRNLRNSGREVAIPAPDWSKKPEDALKTKKGSKRSDGTTKPPGRPRASGKRAQGNVQADRGVIPVQRSPNPAARVTRLGTRSSARNGGGGVTKPKPNPGKQDHDRDKEGQKDVDEPNLVDEEEEEAEHEEARDRIEGVGEEIVTPLSGPAENEAAFDIVEAEVEDYDEPDGNQSDDVDGDQLEMYDSVQGEDNEENQDSETANGNPRVQMPFGQQANWNKVLEGAKSVGVSQRNGVTRSRKPKLVTRTIKALVKQTSALTQLYIEYGPLYADRENTDGDSIGRLETLRKHIAGKIGDLSSRVERIDEAHADTKKSEMIRDIYTHGIPKLVFLLQAVLLCYVNASCIGSLDLKRIIRIQNIVLLLCTKASKWVAKPNSDRPIIRATRQLIFPYLRDVKKVFLSELRQRERSIDINRQRVVLRRRKERVQERERLKREQYERERDEHLEWVKAELDREAEEINYLRQRRGASRMLRSSSLSSQPQADAACEDDAPDDSGPPIERVQMFGRRGEHSFSKGQGVREVVRDHGADKMVVSWSFEEREWLMIGLQMYQGETHESYHTI